MRPAFLGALAALFVGLPGTTTIASSSAVGPPPMSLSADRVTYGIGTVPAYRITNGAPNAAICWDSYVGRNGAPAVSAGVPQVCSGDHTDGSGNWSGTASAWTGAQLGAWLRRAHVAGATATTSFTVGTTLTTDRASYVVGQQPVYDVRGAPPGSCLLWQSWINAVPTGEENACYSQVADASGDWTSAGTPFAPSQTGTWVKEVTVGGESWEVSFTVYAATPDPGPHLVTDGSSYAVGQVPRYTLRGAPPHAELSWSSTHNGVPTGELDSKYGQYTDAQGAWSGPGGPWTADQTGRWGKMITVAGRTTGVTLDVGAGPPDRRRNITGLGATYFWDGSKDGAANLDRGAEAISALGGTVLRLRYSSAQCDSSKPVPFDLVERALEPDAVAAFSDPAIATYVLTIVSCPRFAPSLPPNPWGSFESWYLDPLQYAGTGQSQVVAAYSAFTAFLRKTYPGKRFVLSNWESDHAVYCGSALRFALDPTFRTDCSTNYTRNYPFALSVTDTLDGLRAWFDARQAGVEAGRPATGEGSTAVLEAPEINAVHVLRDRGFAGVLDGVLPRLSLKPDLISFSSYEAANLAAGETAVDNDVACRLRDDLGAIQAISGSTPFIGEFSYSVGLPQDGGPSGVRILTAQLLAEAAALRVPYAVQWETWNDDVGLTTLGGSVSSLGVAYAGWLVSGLPASLPTC